jgi:hypothetical protein
VLRPRHGKLGACPTMHTTAPQRKDSSTQIVPRTHLVQLVACHLELVIHLPVSIFERSFLLLQRLDTERRFHATRLPATVNGRCVGPALVFARLHNWSVSPWVMAFSRHSSRATRSTRCCGRAFCREKHSTLSVTSIGKCYKRFRQRLPRQYKTTAWARALQTSWAHATVLLARLL